MMVWWTRQANHFPERIENPDESRLKTGALLETSFVDDDAFPFRQTTVDIFCWPPSVSASVLRYDKE